MYELWARSRTTHIYRRIFIENFNSKDMFDMVIDRLDKSLWSEAMILKENGRKASTLERYEEFNKENVLSKHL